MKKVILSGLLATGAAALAPLFAVTTAFTPNTLTQAGDPPGPSIDGGTGMITLTTASNGQNNQIAFDRSDAGTFASSNFSFTFQVTPTTATADGFSVLYYPTSTGGITGAVPAFTGEEPNVAGAIGFAFDTWNNAEVGGISDSNLSQIALHWNGAVLTSVDDTRLLPTPFAIDDGNVHSVTGTLNFAGATLTLAVDGQAIFNNVAVPGLVPYESRIVMAGRTGGENQRVDIGGLNVAFVPEPMSALLVGLGGIGLVLRRRR
jgi:hypothetical protein